LDVLLIRNGKYEKKSDQVLQMVNFGGMMLFDRVMVGIGKLRKSRQLERLSPCDRFDDSRLDLLRVRVLFFGETSSRLPLSGTVYFAIALSHVRLMRDAPPGQLKSHESTADFRT
jgi:hypothetical protein